MDWNRASGAANIGTFILTVVVVVLMALPMVKKQAPSGSVATPPSPTPTQTTNWVLPTILAVSLVVAGFLQLKAARTAQTPVKSEPPARVAQSPPAAPPAKETPAATETVAVSRPPDSADRIFINKSLEGLIAPFESGLTAYQAKKLVADYLSKWVRWRARVSDVRQYGTEASILAILPIRQGKTWPLSISMGFAASETKKVIHLEKNTLIEVEGMITDIETDAVKLAQCRLVSVQA
jgi:hypothetical protein